MPVCAWRNLTTVDVSTRDMSRSIAVLPVAATEQHGPHLPLGTDEIIAEGYLGRIAALAPAELDVLVLPIQAIGTSGEHGSFPGTLSLTTATALSAWTEIGTGIHAAGCRKLVIVTSHGGNSALIDLVAGALRNNLAMVVVTTSWSRLGYPGGLVPEAEIRHGIHAGGIETALLLALRPDLVRQSLVENFEPRSVAMERDFSILRAGRPAAFAWKAEDLHPSGAIGNASLGTAEIGDQLLSHGAKQFVELLAEVDRFDLKARVQPANTASISAGPMIR